MKLPRRFFFTTSLVVMSFALVGCEMMQPTSGPTVDTQTSYIPVEYRKFVSGVYVSELKNKYVQVDCAFSSTFAGTLPGGYSPDRYMSFLAMADGTGLESPETLTVIVPKDLADIVFGLKHSDRLRVKGRALEVLVSRALVEVLGRNLVLEATTIEKLQ